MRLFAQCASILVIILLSGCLTRMANEPPPATSAPVQETPPIISEVQSQLNAKGFNVGKPDGIAGPRTREAIRKFEAANNLPVDGIIDGAMLTALRQSDTKPILPANERNAPSGEGMIGVRYESANAAGVTLRHVFFSNDANNLRIADEHCAKYGKTAQFVAREQDRRRYNCVNP